MKGKRLWLVGGVITLAAVLIILGLQRVYLVYQHYRADILANESSHLGNIVSASAGGLDWMLNGYERQLDMLTTRMEFAAAEANYAQSGDPSIMRSLMARRDILRFDQPYSLAVWDDGALLGTSDAGFPYQNQTDEPLGVLCSIRQDDLGRFWFIFTKERDSGLRYEMAVQVFTLFSDQAASVRIGNEGMLFIMDRELRFVGVSVGGESYVYDAAGLIDQGNVEMSDLEEILEGNADDYMVIRYPGNGSSEESLVVTVPVMSSGDELVIGAALRFSEFDSFLSDTLKEVAWIILLELGGALVLVLMAAWVMVQNRRNALELSAVREQAELMEEINRQQQSLYHSERLQQLGVMTGGMVHEFNNMLTPIMGQSMLLLEQLADRDDSPEFEYALDVYEASEKARDVLKRMSAMGKKDGDMGFRVLELCTILQKTMNLSSMAKNPHIQQVLKLPRESLFIEGSEQLLTQAFLNLCINACQAMGESGVLTVTANRETLSGREYAVILVQDTGPGIPQDALGSIYDPFFTTKGERGTGLGLAICKKIIESHKGTIQAANRETGGAEFSVRIPMTKLPDD